MSKANRNAGAAGVRWWAVSLLAALVAVGILTLVVSAPTWKGTWIIAAAALVFAFVALRNPDYRYYRLAAMLAGGGSASLIMPRLGAYFHWSSDRYGGFLLDADPWAGASMLAAALGFALLDYRHHRSCERSAEGGGAIQIAGVRAEGGSQAAGRDQVIVGDGANYIHNEGAVDPGTFKKVVDRYESDLALRDASLAGMQTTLAERQSQIETLQAALARVQGNADRGDPQAQAAIAEARRSGDVEQLQAALVAEADRQEAGVRAAARDYIELCREIAAIAYLRGDIDEARHRLEIVLRFSAHDLDAVNRMGHIHLLRGDLDTARSCYEEVLDRGGDDGSWQAIALGNLGLIYESRGELDRAEEMLRKALAIEEKLGRQEGMAKAYSNLGLIYQTRGELDRAEEMHGKALAINENLGRQEGMAIQYTNLGLLYGTRGELDRAEEMHRKVLAIEEKLGRQEGVARGYGNLGLIHWMRGELDLAEQVLRTALAIDESMGRQEGMANQYGNLGLIYRKRRELDRAAEMYRKALSINEKLGRQDGMANQYANLGVIYQTRGELDRAEEMLRKSLAIDEQLGRQGGMALAYANLGSIEKERGNPAAARDYWIQARDLYARMGLPRHVSHIEAWLAALPAETPDPRP